MQYNKSSICNGSNNAETWQWPQICLEWTMLLLSTNFRMYNCIMEEFYVTLFQSLNTYTCYLWAVVPVVFTVRFIKGFISSDFTSRNLSSTIIQNAHYSMSHFLYMGKNFRCTNTIKNTISQLLGVHCGTKLCHFFIMS
jgi:cytochrome b561